MATISFPAFCPSRDRPRSVRVSIRSLRKAGAASSPGIDRESFTFISFIHNRRLASKHDEQSPDDDWRNHRDNGAVGHELAEERLAVDALGVRQDKRTIGGEGAHINDGRGDSHGGNEADRADARSCLQERNGERNERSKHSRRGREG